MRFAKILLLAAMTALFFTAPYALAAEVDRIVAVVNGEIITMRQLDKRVAAMMKSGQAKGASQSEVRRKILDTLVEQELVNQAAKTRGVMVTPADVNKAIDAIKKENNLTDAKLRASLAQSGSTMESFREDLTIELLRNKIMGSQIASAIVVTDREVLAVLNGEGPNMASSGFLGSLSPTDGLPVRLILIPVNPADKAASLTEARLVKNEIESGLSFAEAARKYSRGPGAENGGDTGENLVVGQLHPTLKAAVANIEPGAPSEPVDMGNAFVILTALPKDEARAGGRDKKTGALSDFPPQAVETARRRLERHKMQQRYTEWLKDLKGKAIVRINL